jgi:TonB family protein
MKSKDGRTVPVRWLGRAVVAGLLVIGLGAASLAPLAWGEEELVRRTKSKVAPSYPELAQRMKIAGVVRVLVTVSPNGSIKEMKLMGGHPVLGNAALDAVRKWRFTPAPGETTGIVEFRFDPTQ